MVIQPPLAIFIYAQLPAIVPDGRTQTSVTSNQAGTITDVRTNSVKGINAYNSFDRFNVPNGNTTNLHVPDSAKNLVNLIHNERSQIDGVLNSYKNGQIGGNVFFLNPHGVVVGASGTINVGSLHLQTPTQQYLKDLVSENGEISAVHEQQLFEGKVPLSPSGTITVKGKINAVEEVQLKAGDVNIAQGAKIRAGRQVQVEFGDLVNVRDVNWGNDLVVTPEGKIKIVATNNVEVAGEVKADAVEDAVEGNKAGNIEIEAGNDINVREGAEISAKGNGENSDGGEIIIYAENNSTLEKDATVDVSSQTGTGGFIEFSAKKLVTMQGWGLKSSSGGTILIDPTDLTFNGEGDDKFTDGANIEITASDSITLNDVYFSTRKVNDANLSGAEKRNAHLTGNSTGNSGDIIISAPNIKIENSTLIASATGSYSAGNILFNKKSTDENLSYGYDKADDFTIPGTDDKGLYVKIINSSLIANSAKSSDTNGQVLINLQIGGKWYDQMDIGGNVKAEITFDSDSKIKANAVEITSAVILGNRIENVIPDSTPELSELEAEENKSELLKVLGKVTDMINTVIDNAQDKTVWLENNLLGLLPVNVNVHLAGSEINIAGNITAERTINIDSAAAADTSLSTHSIIAILGVSAAYMKAVSEVNISGTLKTNQRVATENNEGFAGISIRSFADTKVEISTGTVGFLTGNMLYSKVPGELVISVGVEESVNRINVAQGANLNSSEDIEILASTKRNNDVSAKAAEENGRAKIAIATAVMVGKSETAVNVNGTLTAVDKIDISAITENTANAAGATSALNVTDLSGIIGEVGSIIGKLKNPMKWTPDDENKSEWSLSFAFALLLDNMDNSVTIGGNAKITAPSVNIASYTKDPLEILANASGGHYFTEQWKDSANRGEAGYGPTEPVYATDSDGNVMKDEDGNPIPARENVEKDRDNVYTFAVPILVVNNSTVTKILDNAQINASNQINITAKTEIPLGDIHPIYSLYNNIKDDGFLVGDLTELFGMFNSNLGLDNFNVWSLTSSESTKKAVGVMLGTSVVNNETITQLGNITIDGIDNIDADLLVSADTIYEQITLAGNMRSFISRLPTASDITSINNKLNNYTSGKKTGDIFQNMWGAQADSAIGAAVLVTYIGNTTIARIDGGTIKVKDLDVAAATKTLDIGISLGAASGGETGFEGMFGVSVLNNYTL
ncbi:MAG: leukotoxin LktA family filamentous adhesin, partial [Planctomycetaceae bacterium]|nr:leukotoxin LktA family filamentous adhesin [Planctomycetaceae bacterium]